MLNQFACFVCYGVAYEPVDELALELMNLVVMLEFGVFRLTYLKVE